MTKLCKVNVPNGSLPQADLDGDGNNEVAARCRHENPYAGFRLPVKSVCLLCPPSAKKGNGGR